MCAKWCVICVRFSSTSFPLKRVHTYIKRKQYKTTTKEYHTNTDGDNDAQ